MTKARALLREERLEDALEMKEGATSQGMQVTSELKNARKRVLP